MKRELMGLIVKGDDGAEIINYDDPAFPSYIYDGWIAPKVTWERVPHYHEDIEIVTVKSGKMAYSVNGQTLYLNEGDTIVVNSNQVHYSICVDEKVARYVIFIIHPSILASSVAVEMQAVKPITDNPDLPYMRFRGLNEYTDQIYELMMGMPEIRHDAFAITKQFFLIWDIIRKQCESWGATGDGEPVDTHMQSIKLMMHFISESYRNSITLNDIAGSANISKSQCNNLFNRYVGQSPVNYLMNFRVRKVAEYLSSTSMPLAEIASLTGFCGTSYMSESFRKFFAMSPREYRKHQRQLIDQ